MRKIFILTLGLLLLAAGESYAIVKDTVSVNIREYKDEEGFFQKANRDLGDPHFMFKDSSSGIEFGIGGTVKASAYYGFEGEVKQTSFKPSTIIVPTDRTPVFGTKISSSEVHVKARMQLGGRKMSAFIKLGGNSDNSIGLKQAYISYGGFSVGLIPSFFTDLEVGVMTTGIGLSNQVDFDHTLFGYSRKINDHWSVAAALENASLTLDYYDMSKFEVSTDYQPVPDIVAHVKYKWDEGHVQLGAVYRNLTYWTFEYPVKYDIDGVTRHTPGFGMALSGNFRPTEKFKIAYEFVSGKGIAAYLSNLSDLNLDVGICTALKDGYREMKGIPVSSGQIAFQYDWSKRFSSSAIVGFSHCLRRKGVENYTPFRNSASITANFFWNMNDYAYMGVEYLCGIKKIFVTPGEPDFGAAHRFAFIVAYCF